MANWKGVHRQNCAALKVSDGAGKESRPIITPPVLFICSILIRWVNLTLMQCAAPPQQMARACRENEAHRNEAEPEFERVRLSVSVPLCLLCI